MSGGSIREFSFENAQVKACEFRLVCGYDPATLDVGGSVEIEDGISFDNDMLTRVVVEMSPSEFL